MARTSALGRGIRIATIVGLLACLGYLVSALSHVDHAPPPLVIHATCDATGAVTSWRGPSLGRHDLADVALTAVETRERFDAAVEAWRWDRHPCAPPPWMPDPTRATHARERATYAECERRADTLRISREHPDQFIGDTAIPILEAFLAEARNDPRWDAELIALQIEGWRHRSSFAESEANYEARSARLGLPAHCALGPRVVAVDSTRLRVHFEPEGEAGLRAVIRYLCTVGLRSTTLTVF